MNVGKPVANISGLTIKRTKKSFKNVIENITGKTKKIRGLTIKRTRKRCKNGIANITGKTKKIRGDIIESIT